MMRFDPVSITLAIGGGVAAYKAADFLRELQRRGVGTIYPVLSQHATDFISPLVLQALSKHPPQQNPLAMDEQGVPWHIAYAQRSEALVVFATTANLLAKFAHGLSDCLVSTTFLTFTDKPVVVIPAMNTRMWEHPATQANWQRVRQYPNVVGIEPGQGLLACGETGAGHLPEMEHLYETLYRLLHPQRQLLKGLSVLVSAGGTREPLDPVRVLSNRSSGRMGHALADELWAMGADVTLVSASPLAKQRQTPYTTVVVETVNAMREALLSHASSVDWILKAAAVSDYRIAEPSPHKIKKSAFITKPDEPDLTLSLVQSPDILKELSQTRLPHQRLVGFAAETDHWLAYAQQKMASKGLDAIALNDVSRSDIGFDSPENEFIVCYPDGSFQLLEKASKGDIARQLILTLHQRFSAEAFRKALPLEATSGEVSSEQTLRQAPHKTPKKMQKPLSSKPAKA
jgi:phosphopantothenoylcysteine decarboxylase / phosphopantothenate---cysteine ligase